MRVFKCLGKELKRAKFYLIVMARKQRSYEIRDEGGKIVHASFAVPDQEPHEDFRDEEHRLNGDEQLEHFGATTILSPEELFARSKYGRRYA